MLTAAQLTNGERLALERRRAGETKAGAAKRHGVSLYCYTAWEDDEDEAAPRVAVGRVAFYEGSRILRRRAGRSVADMAAAVGVSPYWLSRMEAGEAPDDRLREFWTRRPSS